MENTEQADTEENISTEGVADYPAAIMVNDTVYLVEGGVAVLYKNEWYLGTPFSIEHTTTFPGIIIDHTLESSVPVICVKTLDEEAIPYEEVFFELPEGEKDWALKIDAEVLITCSGGFTEPAPHFGTLISITEMGESDIDVDV